MQKQTDNHFFFVPSLSFLVFLLLNKPLFGKVCGFVQINQRAMMIWGEEEGLGRCQLKPAKPWMSVLFFSCESWPIPSHAPICGVD